MFATARRLILLGGISFLISIGAASAAEDEDQAGRRPPNVLFLLSDDQRPDTIHALENGLIRTPNLDRLVRRGTTAPIADAAIGFLRRVPDRPFFLHVNFTAPHDPLIPTSEAAGRYDPETIPLPVNFLPEHPFDHGNLRGRDEQLWPWPRTPRM